MMTSQKTDATTIPFYRDERILNIIAQIVSTILIFGFLIWAVVSLSAIHLLSMKLV